MGYRLNRLDEPIFMAVPKPMLTEFGIHYRLESCVVDCKRKATIEKFSSSIDLKLVHTKAYFKIIKNSNYQ